MIYDKKSISYIQIYTVIQHSDVCVNSENTMDHPFNYPSLIVLRTAGRKLLQLVKLDAPMPLY